MYSRHCVVFGEDRIPEFRLGSRQVFDPWIAPELLLLQGYNLDHPESRSGKIEFHFRRTMKRLVRSLDRLFQCSSDYAQFLNAGGIAGPNAILVFEIPEDAGIAADSVFHYLGLLVDDLARIIPYVFLDENTFKEPDGFTDLKRQLAKGGYSALDSIKNLFMELDNEDSWWSLGFQREIGMRQRLTHYTDLVVFGASTKPGDAEMTTDISLSTVGGPVRHVKFEEALQRLLSHLCEWFDQLYVGLIPHLSGKLVRRGVFWNPFSERLPSVRLPKVGNQCLNAQHYLYLPICNCGKEE
jgi:hypothetical protein